MNSSSDKKKLSGARCWTISDIIMLSSDRMNDSKDCTIDSLR